MKKSHLTTIKKVAAQLEKLKAELEAVKDELQNEYDNLSVRRQEGEYGEELQDALDALDSAICDGLETAEFELLNATTTLEFLPTNSRRNNTMEDDDFDIELSDIVAASALYEGAKGRGRKEQKKEADSSYDPFDNHWESSFDWVDEDNDGYDDRDDGFWTPAE